jgi:NAD(P)-dependent dehydrogenase (short-subunit alcohol dehydrogenase family)
MGSAARVAHAPTGAFHQPGQAGEAAFVAVGVLTRFGRLDGLVMFVGIGSGDHLAGTPASEWDRVMAVNVRSHFLGCKHALPIMPAGGSIVLISSTAARLPATSNAPAYIASKAALHGLCAATGREAAPRGIRVNIVMPGLIDTSLGRLATLIKPDRAGTPIPLSRQGTAWEVANSVIFLLSDKAAYITGQTLVVDGGLSRLP